MRSSKTDFTAHTKRQEQTRDTLQARKNGSSIYYGTDKTASRVNRSFKSSVTASKRSVDSNYTKQSKVDLIRNGKSSIASKSIKSSRPMSSNTAGASVRMDNQKATPGARGGPVKQDPLHITKATRGAYI